MAKVVMVDPDDGEEDKTVGGRVRRFKGACYNPVDHTVLGRTCFQWIELIVYYICFYTLLAVFFGVGLFLFLRTLNQVQPKWQGTDSLLRNSPGMGFRPSVTMNSSSILWINGTESTDYSGQAEYITIMQQFMAPYQDAQQTNATFVDCSTTNKPPTAPNVCKVKMSDLGPCAKDPAFGYSSKTPCVAIKLNRIINWNPTPYTNLQDVPVNVTNFFKDKLQQPITAVDPNAVYVTCDGVFPSDVEHMGPISLHPKTIPAYYFPYTNTPSYLSPLVMVQFLNPAYGIVIHVVCSAFAQNLQPDTTYSTYYGIVYFNLLVS